MGLTVEPRHRYSVATGTAHRSAGIRGEGPRRDARGRRIHVVKPCSRTDNGE